MFQHTAARRRLAEALRSYMVSSFNTQPPEGGWFEWGKDSSFIACFNTQPPEGGWAIVWVFSALEISFQHTAARRRLGLGRLSNTATSKFQHTAARRRLDTRAQAISEAKQVSTHSRPKAAGCIFRHPNDNARVSTHSRPKAAGYRSVSPMLSTGFQHTAARRRLESKVTLTNGFLLFQHTAARRRLGIGRCRRCCQRGFNTQPPEGGWSPKSL